MPTARKLIEIGLLKISLVWSVVKPRLTSIILASKKWARPRLAKAAIALASRLVDFATSLSTPIPPPTEKTSGDGAPSPCLTPSDKVSSKKWNDRWDDPELKGPDNKSRKKWLPEYYDED